MRQIHETDATVPNPTLEKKSQAAGNAKGEAGESAVSEMLGFLCSAHRMGRYRQSSMEIDVEYLRWLQTALQRERGDAASSAHP